MGDFPCPVKSRCNPGTGFQARRSGVRPGLGIQVQVGGDGILFGSVVAAHQPLRLFLEFPDNLRGHHVSLDLRVRNAAFIYVGERTGLDFQQFVPEFGCEDNALVSGVSPELAVHHPVYLGRGIDFEVLACLALVRKVGQVRGLGQFQLPRYLSFRHRRVSLTAACRFAFSSAASSAVSPLISSAVRRTSSFNPSEISRNTSPASALE